MSGPQRGVAIVEVQTGEGRAEWVRLRNTGAASVELTGWTLRGEGGAQGVTQARTFTFPAFHLAPGREVRVHTGPAAQDAENLSWATRAPVWSDVHEDVVLRDAQRREVSRLPAHGAPEELPRFPPDFLWGVATAGYQVEGRTQGNDWDVFTTSPGIQQRFKVVEDVARFDTNLHAPGEAVNHFDLDVLREDLDRACALGLNAYRFSIEWGRVQPRKPTGADAGFDAAALAYYDTVLKELHQRRLTPVVTLSHLSLPVWVLDPPRTLIPSEDEPFRASLRGWESAATVAAYLRYVRHVVERYRGSVHWWLTLNEPVGSVVGLGYVAGIWPPGFILDGNRAKDAYFNLLRAHAQAYDAIKALQPGASVGLAHAMLYAKRVKEPGLGNAHDGAKNQFDYFNTWHLLNALVHGKVDTAIHRRAGSQTVLAPQEVAGFLGVDAGPWRPRLDFIGINYYRAVYVYQHAVVALAVPFLDGAFENDVRTTEEHHGVVSDLGWEHFPDGLYQHLARLHRDYGLPVLVSENGLAERTDRNRAAYTLAHLTQVQRALKDGVAVKGYLHWTLVDNFEWHEGYRPEARFGLFTVDRDRRDARGQHPRHITEGALALAHAVAERSVGPAVRKFGTVTVDGHRVRPPVRTPGAVWHGELAEGVPFTLCLDRLEVGGWLGLLFDAKRARWLRLEGVEWDAAARRLLFSHPAHTGTPSRSFEATVEGDSLRGTLRDAGVPRPWHARRDALFGVWDDGTSRLVLANLEGEARGGLRAKWLRPLPREAWRSVPLAARTGPELRLTLPGSWSLTATLEDGALKGRRVPLPATPGGELPFHAFRLPDDVPF